MKAVTGKSQRGLLRSIEKRAKAQGRLKDRQPPAPAPEKADK